MSLLQRIFHRLVPSGFARQSVRKTFAAPANLDRQTALLQQLFLQHLLEQPRYRDPKRLHRFEQQVFSQNGEDGAVAEIFRRIGVTDRRFVEIGVGDGLENLTTFWLAQGWQGWWLEGDEKSVAAIREHFWQPLGSGALQLHQAFITAENIGDLLARLQVPGEFDLLSLDIDRNTWFVWRALQAYRPRVAVIEYNASWPADVDWTVEYRPDLVHNCTAYMGASLKAYERLGRELGYALVGCDLGGINAYFVRRDLCGDKFCEPFTAENHYEPPRYFLLRRDGHPRCFTDLPKPA
ncbi:MAG: hypothetical protein KA236_13945 [Verrucomicrobia bacterium]|jgi:hypothetical protein|nr:hypothetical protein [Verrucomicrobiota bacterium]